MESPRAGALVTVEPESGAPPLQGIVFDVTSHQKVVVAVPDPARGAVLRSFAARELAEREAPAPADAALERLIRRTPSSARGGPRSGSGGGHGLAGHTRARMHRTTGK
jgi:hypothetical protein